MKKWASKTSTVKCSQRWTNLICCAKEATALVTAESEATSNVAKISTVSASFANLRMKSFQSILMCSPANCSVKRTRRRRSTRRRCFLMKIRSQLLQPRTLRMMKNPRVARHFQSFNLRSLSLMRLMKLKMKMMLLAKTTMFNRIRSNLINKSLFLKMMMMTARKD